MNTKKSSAISKQIFENTLLSENGFDLIISNQGQKRKLVPYTDKINFEPQHSTKKDGIQCPHFIHESIFSTLMGKIENECPGFIVHLNENVPKAGQKVQGLTEKDFKSFLSVAECKNNVVAMHGYCSNCNNKFKQWRKIRELFNNRFFHSNFIQKGYSASEIDYLHDADDCWPLKIQSNDWIGFVRIPSYSIDDCRTNILAHEDIVDAVMKWINYCGNPRCSHKRCITVDSFVREIVKHFHQHIPDATTMQYLSTVVSTDPPYNLHLDDAKNIDANGMCVLINDLTNEYFPRKKYASETILLPMNHVVYYRRKQGEGKVDYQVPVRIVMASFALATALEESNRGDARWDRLKEGFSSYYSNIWMPMGIFFLMRNGATLDKAKKAIKQA
jgi:hypothetical protein